MFKKIEEIFSIPELRKRIFMTLLLLAIFRIGAHIPTPGVDGQALSQFFQSAENNILGFLYYYGAFSSSYSNPCRA